MLGFLLLLIGGTFLYLALSNKVGAFLQAIATGADPNP